MPALTDNPIYETLAVPDEAIANGGVEILRACLVDKELYVAARRAFKDPAQWGEVLADIARRIALFYSAEDTDLTEKEIIAEIEEAFAAEMGAKVIKDKSPRRKRPVQKRSRAKTAGKASGRRRAPPRAVRKVSRAKRARRGTR